MATDVMEIDAMVKALVLKGGKVRDHIKKNLKAAQVRKGIWRQCRIEGCTDTASYGRLGVQTYPTGHNPMLCYNHAKELESIGYDSRDYPNKPTCACCEEPHNYGWLIGPKGGVHAITTIRAIELTDTPSPFAKFYKPLPDGIFICAKCQSTWRTYQREIDHIEWCENRLASVEDPDDPRHDYVRSNLVVARTNAAELAPTNLFFDTIVWTLKGLTT